MRLRNRNLSQSPAETLTTPDARRPKTTGRKKRPKNELTQEEHKKEDVPRGASTTPRRTRKRGPKSTSLETNENPGLSSDRSDEITADAKSAENSQAGEDSSSILTPNRTPSINHAPSRTARQSSRRKRLVPDDNWAQEATSSPVLTRRRARERMQNKQSNFQEDTNNEAENSPNNDYGSSLNNAHQVESNEKSQKKVEKVIQPEQDLGSTLTDTAQIQPGSLVSGVGDTGDDPVSKQQSDLNSRKLPNDKPGIPSSSPCSLITAEPKKTTPSPTFRKAGTQNENNSPLKTTQAVSSSVSKNQLKTKKRKKKKRRNNLDNDEEEAPEQISFGDGMQSVLQRISAEQEAIQMAVQLRRERARKARENRRSQMSNKTLKQLDMSVLESVASEMEKNDSKVSRTFQYVNTRQTFSDTDSDENFENPILSDIQYVPEEANNIPSKRSKDENDVVLRKGPLKVVALKEYDGLLKRDANFETLKFLEKSKLGKANRSRTKQYSRKLGRMARTFGQRKL